MVISTTEYLKAPRDINFDAFFKHAIGATYSPYPFQEQLAREAWPDLVKVETGMGKTAAVILAWLFKRLQEDPHTPRRLVYCLPMRVLVEQTAENARQWINKLVSAKILPPPNPPSVYVLMGGEIDVDWDRFPERDAILIGTQDQLLSRALNRGYSMSRFRWPIQFGLLNNDCLWVMDEVQLMGAGLSTTTQLDAFRQMLGTVLPCRSIWMSATLNREWLKTVDFAGQVDHLTSLGLSPADQNNSTAKKRLMAVKILAKAACSGDKPKDIAAFALEAHQKGKRTLLIVNTVKRAIDVYTALKKLKPKPTLVLLHSRFRPGDRKRALAAALAEPAQEGTICVSTQVVEAGVDLSAATLITDLCPWASIIQRFGRCNRYGEEQQGLVYWLERDLEKKGAALPYDVDALEETISILGGLNDVGLQNLPGVSSRAAITHVLRRKDIMELFDTTPDLAGADIDVSRFIRETAEHDVQVFWRDLPEGAPLSDEPVASREELCSVPVGGLTKAWDIDKWAWEHLERRWLRVRSIHPGMTLMLPVSAGGYSSEVGWTGKEKHIPEVIERKGPKAEAFDDDPSESSAWQSLSEHSEAVVQALERMLTRCSLEDSQLQEALLLSARWHDLGKSHPVFQETMLGEPPEADTSEIWGKTARRNVRYARRGFRHELASAIGIILQGHSDLAAYLAAAHHGKVRLSIRSLPHETKPEDPNTRFARGIWDGDLLPPVDLGGGVRSAESLLSLELMEMGASDEYGQSWLERMANLLIRLGPFRLAFLESLLRISDWRASGLNAEEGYYDKQV